MMWLTSLVMSILWCLSLLASAVVCGGLALAAFRLMQTRDKKLNAISMNSMTVGFLQFLAIAVINFVTASSVLLVGPIVYVMKVLLSPSARRFRSVLITGGSSGIGEQLALKYAEEPDMRLVLIALEGTGVNAVAEKCRAKGAEVVTKEADVQDGAAIDEIITVEDEKRPFDLVIANAGISNPDKTFTPKRVNHLVDVNVKGVFNTILPAMARMKARRSGSIAIMSSFAGIVPIPTIAEYSATKSAVEAFGEAIRPHLASHGVGVTNICPGFVKSRMTEVPATEITQDVFQLQKDILMPTEVAAQTIYDAIARNTANVTFPFALAVTSSAYHVLPFEMRDSLTKALIWASRKATQMRVPYVADVLHPLVGLDRTPVLAQAA